MAILTFFLSPIGRYVALALVIVALIGGIEVHGRLAQYHADQARDERNAAHAVTNADAARKAAVRKFDHGSDNNRPSFVPGRVHHGSDGFARD